MGCGSQVSRKPSTKTIRFRYTEVTPCEEKGTHTHPKPQEAKPKPRTEKRAAQTTSASKTQIYFYTPHLTLATHWHSDSYQVLTFLVLSQIEARLKALAYSLRRDQKRSFFKKPSAFVRI